VVERLRPCRDPSNILDNVAAGASAAHGTIEVSVPEGRHYVHFG
jgi:hypothetical protein